jgi:hypothetical protein
MLSKYIFPREFVVFVFGCFRKHGGGVLIDILVITSYSDSITYQPWRALLKLQLSDDSAISTSKVSVIPILGLKSILKSS